MLEPFAPENEVMFGTTVTPIGADTGLVPVASALVAVKLCAPFDNALTSKAHAPLLFAVVAPRSVVPSNTFTVLFAPAVPTNFSSLTSVIPSPTVPVSGEIDLITGAIAKFRPPSISLRR